MTITIKAGSLSAAKQVAASITNALADANRFPVRIRSERAGADRQITMEFGE